MIGQQIGSYKIVRVLGEGGMGEVFEAVHDKLHRRAAIKVLHPHVARAPEMAARFRNEARAVNIIRHPGVVDIYEHGQLPDGTVYLVMEYLEGRSLRETLEQEVLTEAQAILLSQQLASALATAHSKGIIHRDLKPDIGGSERGLGVAIRGCGGGWGAAVAGRGQLGSGGGCGERKESAALFTSAA